MATNIADPFPAVVPHADDPHNISSSYFSLRRGLAGIAIAFLIVLWIAGGPTQLQSSISAYYHFDNGALRDVFVGVLCAIGAFLHFYRGYSTKENIALNCAGIAAVLIALFPMTWPEGARTTWTGYIHGTSAVLFFLLIAYVCVFRSAETLRHIDDPNRRAWFARAYKTLGTLMIAVPASIWIIHQFFPAQEKSYLVFAIEVAGIYVFSAFWLIKSWEIASLKRRPETQAGFTEEAPAT
ncbi:DUF998 domain-containing protein [Sphingomonas lenta]|uniref:DUF998 domain-containing protein n=1 Tax=Sphingomonas lenta TaxID=1141887 RepID=A0A2A2SEX3_9SPHN|nr:DUF998 domain-containing protein [Sphingomonas lenta]PAX07806.1 hypothetical protein CKY28_09260 [Sphingomonas lenta]